MKLKKNYIKFVRNGWSVTGDG
jgi:hypothetical protein